ncbi:WD domain, G-beta repeat protein (macronuclear) [Tetrahymena thermophila SB210]|uniref:WD domain, G-beta repeat protein n=1 Tax=Tetrahymena thermophila (strain SB210) TaxID=312017 RepID=I7LU79_TETTS|nr:WD domain, G-beta repeat protein [Tetrahymena thermophila SB210]EAR90767.2 WD domain, G-beta repeat protein [Tetrahymena thermophila SB210]|eukprot:XP_001011012.2 WD domain, G-beta repeat protein [Tetrahymena thermophila SB210]
MVRERQYLSKQANVNSQTGNVSGSMNQQSISNTNTSNIQNQLANAGNHSKKNSQSNIFSYRKSPQSQLNDIVLQSRVQQNLGQKGIETRYQKDNQQQFGQSQQHFQQEGYQQIYNHDKNNSKGDVVGKFQNGFKHINQMIQNVDRESNLQKEQQQLQFHQQQLQSQQQQLNQFTINTSNSSNNYNNNNNNKRLNSPASSTLQLQGQNISHRQSVVGNNIEELKQSLKQGLINYQFQNQDSDNLQNNPQNSNQQISNPILANKNGQNNSNNHDPNENLSILASKLSEIAQNFSSPGKKLNTASSTIYANNSNVPPSAMKSSNTFIQPNNINQQYSQSMQSSRHASGNLYTAVSSNNQLQNNQQTHQQQQQQVKQQNGISNLSNLKYSQSINQNLNYQPQNNNNYNNQQLQDYIQEQNIKHFSPGRYVVNEYTKQPTSSLATSIANTQKKSQQQTQQKQNQNLNGIYQDMQSNQTTSNQELKPFITDRVVYNQNSSNFSKNQLENNLQIQNVGNKQQRKGAFNNNITKKKRQEMKEYRHFSSIDFKNSEQNSLINNTLQHNHNISTQHNVNNTVSHNLSQIRNISQIPMNQNSKNVTSISAANTSRQQKTTQNQNVIQTVNSLISVEQKMQLMQANKLINSLQTNTNASSVINTNGSCQQDNSKLIQQDTLKINHIAPNPSAQSTMANPTQLTNQIGFNQNNQYNNLQNQGNNSKSNNVYILNKQHQHNSSQSQLQKQENSPNSNAPSRLTNRNNTQRTQSNVITNKNSGQNLLSQSIQQNNGLNNGNNNYSLNANLGKSTNTVSQNSKNKYSLYLLQPSHSPGHQNSSNLLQNQGRVQSATNNSSSNSNQNKLNSNIHNANSTLQNNYLLSQNSSKVLNPAYQVANNNSNSGNSSLGKLTQNLFGNLSILYSNVNSSNGNINGLNNNLGTTSSPNTYNEINQNSTNNLNLKIQKQLQNRQYPQQTQQQQFNLLSSNIAQYKKQGGSTSIGVVQQPLSAKSPEQMIKERRKHSESTTNHSNSANNTNVKMFTNLSQGKQFEEDLIKEQQSASFYKNIQVATTKNSLQSSILQQEPTVSTKSGINKTKFNQQQFNTNEQNQLLNLEKDKIIQKNQKVMVYKNSSKTPERERYPFNTSSSSSRKIEIPKKSKTPKDRVPSSQSSAPNSIALDISQNKDLLQNNSRLKLDERQIISNTNNNQIAKHMQNNIINYQNFIQSHKQVNTLDFKYQQQTNNSDDQNELLKDFILEDNQNNYKFSSKYQNGHNDLLQQYNNLQLPLNHVILQQNFLNEEDDKTNLENEQNYQQEEQKFDQNSLAQNIYDHQQNISINSSHLQKFNQDQSSNIQNTNPNQQLSDSNNIGSSEVSSKINNSHNSFLNPTSNSSYNPIKLQTIDSMIIHQPSQVLHTGMTADKVSSQPYQINQQYDESRDYHEYADCSNVLNNSQGIDQNNLRSISNLKQQNNAYINDEANNDNNINEKYTGIINMQNLEQAIQQQKGKQDRFNQNQQDLQNFLSDNQTNPDQLREKIYKQQEQDLKKYENLNQFLKTNQKQLINSSEKEINNKNLQDDSNKQSTKNLKQQLGDKRKYIFQESSDKKRNQTPVNQTNKGISSYHTQSSTNKAGGHHNQLKINQDEMHNYLNSSAKKPQKPNTQSSPTSKNNLMQNFQSYEPSLIKNYPQVQQAQAQQYKFSEIEKNNPVSILNTQNSQDYCEQKEESSTISDRLQNINNVKQQYTDQQIELNLNQNGYQDQVVSYEKALHANLIQTLSDHKHKINAIAYNSQDNTIFTASHDYNLKAFTSASGEQQDYYCFQTIKHKRWVTSLEYIPNFKILLSGGADGLIKLFRPSQNTIVESNRQSNNQQNEQLMTTVQLEQFNKGHSGTVSGLKYLNDTNLVSSGSDGYVNLFDLETLQVKQKFNQNSVIQSIEWIPQSNLLLNLNEHNLSFIDLRDNKIAFQIQNSDFLCLKQLDTNCFLVGTGQYYNQQTNQICENTPSALLFDLRNNMNQPASIFKPFNGSRINCIEKYEDKNICVIGTDQSFESINLTNNEGNILDSQIPSVRCISIDNVHNRIYLGCQNHDLRIYKTF